MDAAMLDAILDDVAAGVPVRHSIVERGSNRREFYALMATDDKARERYAHAKELALEAMADEMVALADESRIGEKTKETKDGTFTEKGDMVDRSRLQIDTRKWLLSKLAPKKYGDKLDVEHSGGVTVEVMRFGKGPATG